MRPVTPPARTARTLSGSFRSTTMRRDNVFQHRPDLFLVMAAVDRSAKFVGLPDAQIRFASPVHSRILGFDAATGSWERGSEGHFACAVDSKPPGFGTATSGLAHMPRNRPDRTSPPYMTGSCPDGRSRMTNRLADRTRGLRQTARPRENWLDRKDLPSPCLWY